MKILVGMSGGVDSSVAAWMLKDEGHEVQGLSLVLFEARQKEPSRPNVCCSREAVQSASETAARIGVTHASLDVRGEFIEKVVEPFVEAYRSGRTPNPCILCNRHIKFPILLREARKMGFGAIATGHYAQVERDGGPARLLKGTDPRKDQSYVLYILATDELEALVLPLGGQTKERTREISRELGLPAAMRPESQEICFVEDRDYASLVGSLAGEGEPGPIVAQDGSVLGTHTGIHRYTVGQRKGLGIASPEPLYVTAIDVQKNAVHVGLREAAMRAGFEVQNLHWLIPKSGSFTAGVKVRSMMPARPATVEVTEGGSRARVEFDEPQWAPAPGQAAVFYEGDVVVGGGEIA